MSKEVRPVRYRIMLADPYLQPYYSDIVLRMKRNIDLRRSLVGNEGTLEDFANGYEYFGFHRSGDSWIFREWLPGADAVWLTGDFNSWNRTSHPLHRTDGGIWEISLDDEASLKHLQYVKLIVRRGKDTFERLPAYTTNAVMDEKTKSFCARIYCPPRRFLWTDGSYRKRKLANPVIYEAHIGMSSEQEGIATYREFADNVLEHIADLGYNTVLLIAVQEHPYYASYGYQVTNYFAASSRYGTPEDLKYLINKAHGLNLFVLLDVIHSQAGANIGEGLNRMDGTDSQYFLSGDRGTHPVFHTRMFDYSKPEVLRFLLSNLKFWQNEYHFDGFRFTGVTAMIYHNRGIGNDFKTYDQYFSMNTNTDAVAYLQLANDLIHEINPFAVTIAEEGSGMPGMGIPVRAGGIGFDYLITERLPDYWIRLLRDRDEQWDINNLWYELTRRRPQERSIGCCETHDQSLTGNQTLIFRMAGAEMYTGMRKDYHSPVMDRAVDLHKLFRFATVTLASDGYLAFMGNEFGHPEWIDFPREGNKWSYKYARRQWSLADKPELKYQWLENFDRAMLHFVRKFRVLTKPPALSLCIDTVRRVLCFERGDMIYILNFNTATSYTDYFVPVGSSGDGSWHVVFSSDAPEFGGQGRVSMDYTYNAATHGTLSTGFCLYIPCRTAAVLKKDR